MAFIIFSWLVKICILSGYYGRGICLDLYNDILSILMQNAFVLCRLSLKEFMFPMVEFPEPDLFPKTHMIGSLWSEETTIWDKLVRKKSEGINQWLLSLFL